MKFVHTTLFVATLLAASGLSSHADALTAALDSGHSGWSGKASSFSQTSCFSNTYSAVYNNGSCAGSPTWMVGLRAPVNLYYGASVSAGVFAPVSANPLQCFVAAIPVANPTVGTYYSAVASVATGYDTSMSWSLPSLSGFGGLDLYCNMPLNSRLNTVRVIQYAPVF